MSSSIRPDSGQPSEPPKIEPIKPTLSMKFKALAQGKLGEVGRISATISALQQAISEKSDELNKQAGQAVKLEGPLESASKTIAQAEVQIAELSDKIKNLPETNPNKALLRQQLQTLRLQVDTLKAQETSARGLDPILSHALELRNKIMELCLKATRPTITERFIGRDEPVHETLKEAAKQVKELQQVKPTSNELTQLVDETVKTFQTTLENLFKKVSSDKEKTKFKAVNAAYTPPATTEKSPVLKAEASKIDKEAKIRTLSPLSRVIHKNVSAIAQNVELIATHIVEAKRDINKALTETPKTRSEQIAELKTTLAQAKKGLAAQKSLLTERTRSQAADTTQNTIYRWEAELQTLEQKVSLLEALSDKEFVMVNRSVELAHDKLREAHSEHKKNEPTKSTHALYSAASILKQLEDSHAKMPFHVEQYKTEIVRDLRQAVEAGQEPILSLTSSEESVKQKILQGKNLSEKEKTVLPSLLAKVLTSKIHFSDNYDVELDRLVLLVETTPILLLSLDGPTHTLMEQYRSQIDFPGREYALAQNARVGALLNGIQNGAYPIESQPDIFQKAFNIFSAFKPSDDPKLQTIKIDMRNQLNTLAALPEFMATDSLKNAKALEKGELPTKADAANIAAFLQAKMILMCYSASPKKDEAFASINTLMQKIPAASREEIMSNIAASTPELFSAFVNETAQQYVSQEDAHSLATCIAQKSDSTALIGAIKAKAPEWASKYITAERYGIQTDAKVMLTALEQLKEAKPYLERLKVLEQKIVDFKTHDRKKDPEFEKKEAFLFTDLKRDLAALQREIQQNAPANIDLADILLNFTRLLDELAKDPGFLALTEDKTKLLDNISVKGVREYINEKTKELKDPETPRRLGIILSKQLVRLMYAPDATREERLQLEQLLSMINFSPELQRLTFTPELKVLLLEYIQTKSPVAERLQAIQELTDSKLKTGKLEELNSLSLNKDFGPLISEATNWGQFIVEEIRNELEAKVATAKENAIHTLIADISNRPTTRALAEGLVSLASIINTKSAPPIQDSDAKDVAKAVSTFDSILAELKSAVNKNEAAYITQEAFGLKAQDRTNAVQNLQTSSWGKEILNRVKAEMKRELEAILQLNDKQSAINGLEALREYTQNSLPAVFTIDRLFKTEELEKDPTLEAIVNLCISSGPYHVWGSNDPDEGAIAAALGKLDPANPKTVLMKEIFSDFKVRPKNKPERVQIAETMSLVFNTLSDLRRALVIPTNFVQLAHALPIDDSLKSKLTEQNRSLTEATSKLQQAVIACFDEATQSKLTALHKELTDLKKAGALPNVIREKEREAQQLIVSQTEKMNAIMAALKNDAMQCYTHLTEFLLTVDEVNRELTKAVPDRQAKDAELSGTAEARIAIGLCQENGSKNNTLLSCYDEFYMTTVQLNTGGLPQQVDDMLRYAPAGSDRRENVLLPLHKQIRARAIEINERQRKS